MRARNVKDRDPERLRADVDREQRAVGRLHGRVVENAIRDSPVAASRTQLDETGLEVNVSLNGSGSSWIESKTLSNLAGYAVRDDAQQPVLEFALLDIDDNGTPLTSTEVHAEVLVAMDRDVEPDARCRRL